MSSVFDRHVQRYDSWYEKNRHAYLSELGALKKVLPKKGRGLEIGVGTGRFAAPLGIDAGIDPSRQMLALAKARGVKTKQGSGEKIPFADRSFDYAAIIISICFFKHPLKVMHETRRILKTNGKLIIAIVDKNSFLGKAYRKKKSIFYKQARFFGVKEIQGLLRAGGFKITSSYQTLFSLPQRIRCVQMPRKGLGEGGFAVFKARKIRLQK